MKLLIFMTKCVVFCSVLAQCVSWGIPAGISLLVAYASIVLPKEAYKKYKERKQRKELLENGKILEMMIKAKEIKDE